MSELLRHIDRCHSAKVENYRRFWIGDHCVGFIAPALWPALACESVFQSHPEGWLLDPMLETVEDRTAALASLVDRLVATDFLLPLKHEHYPLVSHYGAAPLALIDRTAVSAFGCLGVGQHVNGFMRRPDGGINMWIGERAAHLRVSPGQLDNLIAGGLPYPLSLADNLAKEAHEEAGLSAEAAALARPVGLLSYAAELGDGMRRDLIFIYDLEVSADFVPVGRDGEMAGFHCLPVEEVLEIITKTDRFKWNCNLVVIDFMIRHGIIPPDHPDYLALCQGRLRPHPL